MFNKPRLYWVHAGIIAWSCFLTGMFGQAEEQNWPRFRGANGAGLSDANTVPVKWTEEDFNWRVELEGVGISSPVLWGNQVFITSADDATGKRYLYAFGVADGALRWRREFTFSKHAKHKNNSFATSTPALDAEHVYVVWQAKSESTLLALDHAGTESWRYDLGPFQGGHGPAGSPIVHNGMVIYGNDHEGDSYLLGLDASTGKELWKVPRSGERACYSTPCVYRSADGSEQLIFTHSYQGFTSLNPKTGAKNWELTPFGDFQQRAIASPIVAGDLILGSSGFTTATRNVIAVRPPTDSGGEAVEAYRITRTAPHIPTPVAYNGRVYLWDDRGIVACIDQTTGENIWVARVGGAYYGSPVCVDGKLYCADLDGTVAVIATGDKYELLAKNPIGEGTCATPAVAGGAMFLRTDSHLMAIGGR